MYMYIQIHLYMCIYAQYLCTHYKCMYILLYIYICTCIMYIYTQNKYTHIARDPANCEILTSRHKCVQARNPTAVDRKTACPVLILPKKSRPRRWVLLLRRSPRMLTPRSRWVLLVRRPRMELMAWSGRRTFSAAVALTISRGVCCVRVNVFVYVFDFACLYVKISTCIHIFIYLCIHIYIYAFVHICTYIYIYVHVHVYMHIYTDIYVCIHKYIFIYVHIHIHIILYTDRPLRFRP